MKAINQNWLEKTNEIAARVFRDTNSKWMMTDMLHLPKSEIFLDIALPEKSSKRGLNPAIPQQ